MRRLERTKSAGGYRRAKADRFLRMGDQKGRWPSRYKTGQSRLPTNYYRYELAAAVIPHKDRPESATLSVATEAWPSGSWRRILIPCFRGFKSHRLFQFARQAEWFWRRHHTPYLEGSIPSSRTTGNGLASENLRSTSGCCGVQSPDSPPRPSGRSIRAGSLVVLNVCLIHRRSECDPQSAHCMLGW